jgi:MFS family permease
MFSTLRNPKLVKIYLIPLFSVLLGTMTQAIAVLYVFELGGSTFEVNLIATVRSAMGILLIVPFGILSDRFGRKPMVLYPRLIQFLGVVVYAFAAHTNHLLIASIVGGFAGGAFFPVLLSMIGDLSKPEKRQEAISTFFFFSSIGMLIGPTITSLLLTLPQVSLRNIYQIVMVGQAFFFIYLFTQIKETKPRTRKIQQIDYKKELVNLFSTRNFQSLILMGFLYFFYNTIIQTYIPIYARVDLNLSDAEIASLSTFRNLAVMLIRLTGATFLAKVSMKRFLLTAIILGGINSVLIPLHNSYFPMVFSIFLAGLSYGAVMSLGSTLISISSTLENRGIANSIYMAANGMGRIVNMITTPIAEMYGNATLFLVGGTCAVIALFPTLFYKIKNKST